MKLLAKTISIAALAGMPLLVPAHAAQTDFKLHNESEGTIISLRMANSEGWGPNWLDRPLRPNQAIGMDFDTDGECDLDTHVEFADGTYLDGLVDYCEVDNVYVEEDEITTD